MHILFIMDPVESCDFRWDNSLRLLADFQARQHACWTADTADLRLEGRYLIASCRKIKTTSLLFRKRLKFSFRPIQSKRWKLQDFDLILIRKNPPVDKAYLDSMLLLEKVSDKVPCVNSPRGIRENNEKLSILHFPQWIPKSFVSASSEALLNFQKKLGKTIVIKPLNLRSGKGVFILKPGKSSNLSRLRRATKRGSTPVMAQEFLKVKSGEKRIVLLNGDFLCAYEKRAKRDFRANLSLGASFHRALLTMREKSLCRDLKPFLKKEGLLFVGLDVLDGKLIEINVTSPAGVTEAMQLWPESKFVEAWANFLEDFSHSFRRKA